jgi:hypothetical protein
MNKNRSWAIKVSMATYDEILRSGGLSTFQLKTSNAGMTETAQVGDTFYLIKPATTDKHSKPGIFCDATFLAVDKSGELILKMNEDGHDLFIRENRYIRFESRNLKDHILLGISTSASKTFEAILLDDKSALRLKFLRIKLGTDYDEFDAQLTLLAYGENQKAGLSSEKSINTIKTAIECGRLITSVISKLENFRSLETKDEDNKGRPNGAKIDEIVWAKYFSKESHSIDLIRLRCDIAKSYVNNSSVIIPEIVGEPDLADFERQSYARRIRRGQQKFRSALLMLYSAKCAFTGTSEESVLEACHIIPHSKTGNDSPDNGLLLRSDIHVLFDEHLMTLANDGQHILVHKDVTAPEYARLNRTAPGLRPTTPESHLALIQQHNAELAWAI